MIVHLSRGLNRLLALIVLPLLGLVALAFAVAAIAGESSARSLADSTRLTDAWAEVGTFLQETAPRGETVVVLAGVGAILVGLIVLIAALAPTRDRELHLKDGDPDLGIRRRALRGALQSRTGRVRGVTGVSVRLKPRRRKVGGTVRVRATRTPRGDAKAIDATYTERMAPISDAFGLRTKVQSSVGSSRRARTE
ncbi:DUF6286 domain-containing protein [Patulibacter sp.]|uniref:DUF6286 domain-containing protein n=1 Tax=Patulibacter sp. TaxID=1912859 RepID=UPI0027186CB1|nr:DUF6286 domain-containing protein [Patulibacter sp.]MDO9407982.1 DUF6286 domain-containing protein [Patulibacter sp.]